MSVALAHKAKLSVLWNTGFNLFRDALQFGVMLVLVRLLNPEAYGQFGMANSVIGFISVFAFQNFISHTIQVRNEEDVHYQDQFTAGAFIQIGLFVLTNIVAVGLRFFDDYSAVAPLIHVLSVTFLLEWPCELRRKMLERALDWKRLRLLHGLGLLASSILAVGMGFMGAGVYALVAPGLLVSAPFIYELFCTQQWRPNWQWDRTRFDQAFRFGLTRLGSGITAKIRPLLENGFIVHFLGYASVGFMGRAVGLSTMFCQRLAEQLMYAIYPVLTKVEPGTERYRRMGVLILRLVAWVALPTAVIFAVLAKPVVLTVYGDKWLNVVPLLPWAMFVGALVALFHTTYMLLLAHHGQKFCLQLDFVVLLGNLTALYFGLPFGLMVYLQCLVAIQLIGFIILFWGLCRVGGAQWSGLVMALLPPVVSIIAAYVCSESFFTIVRIDISGFFTALAYGAQFLLAYLITIRLLFLRPLNEILEYLPGKKMIRSVLFVEPLS